MSEDVARMLGAGTTTAPITIDGKECRVAPLSLSDLGELERECLLKYQENYVKLYKALIKEETPEVYERLIDARVEKASRLTLADLPLMDAYDTNHIAITQGLIDWLHRSYPGLLEGTANWNELDKVVTYRFLVATALDNRQLSEEAFKLMTGHDPVKYRIGYPQWWITGSIDGQVAMSWYALRHNAGLTRERVNEELSRIGYKAAMTARVVERVTAPQLGNG